MSPSMSVSSLAISLATTKPLLTSVFQYLFHVNVFNMCRKNTRFDRYVVLLLSTRRPQMQAHRIPVMGGPDLNEDPAQARPLTPQKDPPTPLKVPEIYMAPVWHLHKAISYSHQPAALPGRRTRVGSGQRAAAHPKFRRGAPRSSTLGHAEWEFPCMNVQVHTYRGSWSSMKGTAARASVVLREAHRKDATVHRTLYVEIGCLRIIRT